MGEIMRWRVTRAPQRFVPGTSDLLILPDPELVKADLAAGDLGNLDKDIAAYAGVLQTPATLDSFLTTGRGTALTPANPGAGTVTPVLQNVLALDEWLAARAPLPPAVPPFATPVVGDLSGELTALGIDTSANAWPVAWRFVADLYYLALIAAATAAPTGAYTPTLGHPTRWLLVMGLAGDVQASPSPIKTPTDIHNDLRWRTLVLPTIVTGALTNVRQQKAAVLARTPGFADLFITREEWDHYDAAEIASIENILAGESKSRVHVLVNQTSVTTTTETVTSSLREQDTTTTDLSQLQQQASTDISLSAHIDGQVDTSGNYGGTQVNTHLGGALDFSSATTASRATTQSHETVARAVSRIEQTTRQVRTVSTLTRDSETEEHKFDNAGKSDPVVGVYRWVDQIQNVELDRYPNRFLMEFELSEPGAFTRWRLAPTLAQVMVNALPTPLTISGKPVSTQDALLTAADLEPTPTGRPGHFYGDFVARYGAAGVAPPPGPLTIAVNLSSTQDNWSAPPRLEIANGAETSFSPPAGYCVGVDPNTKHSWTASLLYVTGGYTATFTDTHIDLSVGGGTPIRSAPTNPGGGAPPGTAIQSSGDVYRDVIYGNAGQISQGMIPIALQGTDLTGFEVNVEVYCVPLDATYLQWQNDTYDAIVSAYYALQRAYNQEKASLTNQQVNPVDLSAPGANAQTILAELKRQTIEMLLGVAFTGLDAMKWSTAVPSQPPAPDLADAQIIAPVIQFLEQAFEWETLSYIFYPYYWADAARWAELAAITGNDSDFGDFLRAGSARVVLAARPGFEDQVNLFVEYGIIWGGGPMPAPNDPDYLSIAAEIKAMQQRPTDLTILDSWQVRLPTTLIWLENPAGLPSNPAPTIDTTPHITALDPASGPPGTSVTVMGRNFGDVQGASSVTFNGTAATITSWSSASVVATAPQSATTGPVTVTASSKESNPSTFDVT